MAISRNYATTDDDVDYDIDFTDTGSDRDGDSGLDDASLTNPELQQFIDELWITEVLYELKSGKEATAFCCTGGPTSGVELVAAKVYRPLEERGFRNDAVYQAGRFDAADRRTRLAFQQKSRAGKQVQFASWLGHEFRTLTLLHEAGMDVPRPIAKGESAILMEFIGDADGPAPLLHQVRLDRTDARELFERLMRNIETALMCKRVHGDLSPYNILSWQGKLVIIDFPQAVDPDVNPHAYDLLLRDITNVCAHFRKYAVHANPERIAGDMWTRFRFGRAGG